MKVGCDGCGARYSLADEKIGGKVLRVRCKQCGEPIMVWGWARRSAPPPADPVSVTEAIAPGLGARHETSGLFAVGRLETARPVPASVAAAPTDDLLTIGTPGIETPLLGLPIVAPIRRERSRLTVAMVAIVAVLLIGVLGLLAEVVGRNEHTAAAAAVSPRARPAATRAAYDAPTESRRHERVTPPDPRVATADPQARESHAPADPALVAAHEPETVAPRVVHRPYLPDERPVGVRSVITDGSRLAASPSATDAPLVAAPAAAPPAVAPAPPAPPAAPAHAANDLAELIDRAVPRDDPRAPPEPAPVAAPPEPPNAPGPSREEVAAAMSAVASAVRACGQGTTGTAQVRIVFAANGRATIANVLSGSFAGTGVGSCIAMAARQARVPAFSGATFSVVYPFAVR